MASKLGDVGTLPTSNALGNVGEGQQLAQHTQNIRQHGANIAGQQIYNNPTTPAGQDAQHKWHQNNPTPKMGGLPQQQQNVQNYVDQDVVARGAGPGFAHAQARLQGQQPVAPQQSEASQHAQHNSVMADIKREQSNGGIQNSRVNTINPSRPVDISGDRRREEVKNGWDKGSMDQGGAHYAANGQRSAQLVQQHGPTGVPQAPVAAPTPPPVAQATPPPAAQPWKSKEAEKMYNDSVNKPNSGYNGNTNMGGGSLGGAAAQRPQISSLSPEQGNALTNFQTQNNARMKAEGSTRPPDDFTKLSPGEQKYVHDFNMERGNIPRPVRPPTGQVPNPRNPNKDMNDRPMLPKPPGMAQGNPNIDPTTGNRAEDLNISPADFGDMRDPKYADEVQKKDKELGFGAASYLNTKPVGPKPMWDDPGSPQGLEPLVRGEQGGLENILKPKPQGVQIPPPPGTKNPSLAPAPQRTPPRPIAPPSSGLKGSTTPRAPAPKPKEPFTIGDFTQAVDENSTPVGPRPPRITPPNFKEGMTFKSPVMQQFNTPKLVEGVDKMPTIKKSSPITDTIKASNNPVPVVDTPKPTQQAPAQRKPLFPRLRGLR